MTRWAPRFAHHRAIALYDRLYRSWYDLDNPRAEVGPALRVEIRRCYRPLRLPDGTLVRAGERVGVIHLNNDRVAALHANGLPPIATGLEFRRQLLASLGALATLARPEGRLSAVAAFSATTIFHRGLRRLGFGVEPGGLLWPSVTATYQRALLASLRPAGALRLKTAAYARAERLWISRERLLTLYGDPAETSTPR